MFSVRVVIKLQGGEICQGDILGSPPLYKTLRVEESEQAKELALSMSLSTDSLVCSPCRDDMRRVLADARCTERSFAQSI